MAHRRRRQPGGGFRGRQPLGTGAVARTPTPQQRIVNNYLRLQSARMQLIRRHMKPLPANASSAQRAQALVQLYNLVRVGGTLGMRYQIGTGRQPRTPDEALRTRRADCDELAMLFIAAARHLNISTNGISMGAMEFNTNRPGSNATEGHAVLFIRGNPNQVFDFTRNAPSTVTNFNQATIQNLYARQRISRGGTSGVLVTSIASMQTFTTLSDMAAAQIVQQAEHHTTQAASARTNASKLQNYDSARRYVMQAITLGSRHRYVTNGIHQVSLSIFDGYHSMGDSSYSAGKAASGNRRTAHYNLAMTYYARALQFYRNVPSLARTRVNKVHDIHESRGLIYEARGSHSRALAEYAEMIRLRPTGWSGYRKKMSLEIRLAQATRSRRNRRRYILAAEKTGRTALANIPNNPAMARHRAAIQTALTGVRAYMQRQGWQALP